MSRHSLAADISIPNGTFLMLITPDTKIAALLESHPELEETLLSLSPAFAKLRNPVLRNTVAKVATLRQVAAIGNIPLATLVNHLRDAVGIDERHNDTSEKMAIEESAPSWVLSCTIAVQYDARKDLEAGVHPVGRVISDLARLASDEVYLLITPFLPAPLIDMARGKGNEAWSMTMASDEVRTFFRRLPSFSAGSSADHTSDST